MDIEKERPLRNRRDQPQRSPRTLEDIFKDASLLDFDENETSASFHRGPMRRTPRGLAMWSWAAALVDLLISFALSVVFVLTAFSFVKVSTLEVFGMSVGFSEMFGAGILIMFGSYMIMLRTFLGFTIGEWACGLRMGTPKQRQQRTYALKVILRTFLIAGTGFILLPLISTLLGRDVAGILSGVQLSSK